MVNFEEDPFISDADWKDPKVRAHHVLLWLNKLPSQAEPVATWVVYLRSIANNVFEGNPDYGLEEMDRVKANIEAHAVGLAAA